MIFAEKTVKGTDLLLPAPSEIIWSAIFLGIFILVFTKFVLPRLNAVLDERAEKIDGGLRMAEKMQQKADELDSQREQELAAARQEAAAIREKARHDGARIVEEARARAEAEAERVLVTGRQQLNAERIAASAQLRGELGTLATDLAAKIVEESLSDDDRSRRVIDRFLDDLESAQATTR